MPELDSPAARAPAAGPAFSAPPPEPMPRRPAAGPLKRLAMRMVGSRLYSSVRSAYWLARGPELREPFPLGYKVNAWRHGFLSFSEALYDFPRNDRRDYIDDYTRLYRCARLNPAPQFFDHKFLLRSVLLGKGFPQPATVALIFRNDILLNPFDEAARYVTVDEFEQWLIRDGGDFIIKPQNGRFGRDIYLIEVQNGALVRRRGSETRPFKLTNRNEVLLAERRVRQGAFWHNLYPESSNSIRALTMWTPGDEKPFLGAAAQRIGTADTMPTDNFSGGWIAAPIDPATGRLGTGSRHPVKARGKQLRGITHHPDTSAQIEGAVLPHWDGLRDTVVRAAASLPTNRYVGWDVIVDESGAAVILEGNAKPGLDVVQTHRGLLADPAMRRFYEKCGVL